MTDPIGEPGQHTMIGMIGATAILLVFGLLLLLIKPEKPPRG